MGLHHLGHCFIWDKNPVSREFGEHDVCVIYSTEDLGKLVDLLKRVITVAKSQRGGMCTVRVNKERLELYGMIEERTTIKVVKGELSAKLMAGFRPGSGSVSAVVDSITESYCKI